MAEDQDLDDRARDAILEAIIDLTKRSTAATREGGVTELLQECAGPG